MPGTNHEAPDGRGGASQRGAHGRRRVRVRRGVAAASLATFALTWGVIAGSGSMGTSTSTAAGARSTSPSAAHAAPSGNSGAQAQLSPGLTTRQS
jgi:hypothetical protein